MVQGKIWAGWLRRMEGDEEDVVSSAALTKLCDAVTPVTSARTKDGVSDVIVLIHLYPQVSPWMG